MASEGDIQNLWQETYVKLQVAGARHLVAKNMQEYGKSQHDGSFWIHWVMGKNMQNHLGLEVSHVFGNNVNHVLRHLGSRDLMGNMSSKAFTNANCSSAVLYFNNSTTNPSASAIRPLLCHVNISVTCFGFVWTNALCLVCVLHPGVFQ